MIVTLAVNDLYRKVIQNLMILTHNMKPELHIFYILSYNTDETCQQKLTQVYLYQLPYMVVIKFLNEFYLNMYWDSYSMCIHIPIHWLDLVF